MRLLLIAALASTSAAWAASPEESYIAARDQSIEKLERMEKAKAAEGAVEAEEKKALADLEQRLRGIIGDLSVKDFPAKGKINLERLTDEGVGFGRLDGLVFSMRDEGPRIVATTKSLLERWLNGQAEWWKKQQKNSPDMESALRSDGFYTEAIDSDAAFTKSAELPLAKPDGAVFVHAILGGWAQDIGPFPPDQIIVAMRKGGKVFIASARTKAKITKIPVCEKLWKDSEIKAEKAYSAYHAGGAKDEKLLDEHTLIQEKGDADFHACFNERAPREAFFPAVVREAQAFADRLAPR
jgi:hypothetical protein